MIKLILFILCSILISFPLAHAIQYCDCVDNGVVNGEGDGQLVNCNDLNAVINCSYTSSSQLQSAVGVTAL